VKAPGEWWELLDFLAPDAREDFGRLMAQLDKGMVTRTALSPTEEPAGWAGVARKGPWERLAPSQWALADAAPEEFARRADEGELAFWDLAQESPEAARSIWIWVDAGPDQLGACRVVQIALLLWLQRACFRSGGEFYWGTVQSPKKGYEQLGADELRVFLAARSVDPPRRPPERLDGLQTWCVGAPEWMTQVPIGIQRVSLRELNSDSVELQAFGRHLKLTLPTARRAVRLLRDPLVWQLSSKTSTMPAYSGRMIFSPNAKKLLIATDEQITVFPIPSSINEPLGKPRVYKLPWKGEVIALSMNGKAINLVLAKGDKWCFSRLNPSGQKEWTEVPALEKPGGGLGACWKSGKHWRLWLDDSLYRADYEELELVTKTRGGFALGRSSLLATEQGTLIDSDRHVRHTIPICHQRVLLAGSYSFQVARLGYTMACQITENLWRLFRDDETDDVQVEGEVVGLHCDYNLGPMLVVDNKGWLHLQTPDKLEPLDLDERLGQCLVHPNGLLAYKTKSKEVVCYDLHHRTRLWLAKT
jgi:hypothetical protein